MSGSEHYERPAVTVDIIVVARQAGRPEVLLIRRKNPPYAGSWALPGGFVEPHEPLAAAARRELEEEAGIVPKHLAQLQAFGDPGRDPRGWTISVAYLALLSAEESEAMRPRAGSDAAEAGWFDLDHLPPLAFDHGSILDCARRRIQSTGPDAAAIC